VVVMSANELAVVVAATLVDLEAGLVLAVAADELTCSGGSNSSGRAVGGESFSRRADRQW